MASDQDLTARVRAALGGTIATSEVKMFGGTAFMLNGNMLVAASPRGLLVRVGKEAHAGALNRSGARPMEMKGRIMAGYIRVDPSSLTGRTLKSWLALGLRFVGTLPAKRWAASTPTKKPKQRTNKGGKR